MSSSAVTKLATRIENPTLDAVGHALSGATAGAFALCFLYPLDQIKVRKAVRSDSRILTINTILDDFIHFRIENIMDIYRGLSFGILEQFLFNGVYFGFYQFLKSDWKRKYASNTQKEMPWITSLIRGSIAGLLTQIFTTPLKVIQLRKQTASNHQSASLSNILSVIYNENGITGFWSGMKASVILVINPAIVQFFYAKIRTYLINKLGLQSSLIDFFAGALSKAIATVICFPLVRIKMNLQAGTESMNNTPSPSPSALGKHQNGKYENGKLYEKVIKIDEDEKDEKGAEDVSFVESPSKKRTSMRDIFDSTMSEKGFSGLYDGLGPKLVHASLTNAITFASKERFVIYTFAMMLYLQRINEKRAMQMRATKMAT